MPSAACCDTSFLFSLYGHDAHTPRAITLVRQLASPITITVLNDYELSQAAQFAVFRQLLSPANAKAILAAFEADTSSGRLVRESCNLAEVVTEAKHLSLLHTPSGGHCSFDILHVAAAVRLKAAIFLTFDSRQRALAQVAGLKPIH